MNRVRRCAGAGLLLAGIAAGCAPAPQAPARPNIVLIVIDALRRDHLPIYGYGKDTAPFLTKLARSGVVFESAHSTSAWTAPAVASILTGLYPFQHGVVTGLEAAQRAGHGGRAIPNVVPDELDTAAEILSRAGYATFAITTNVNLVKDLGYAQGFGHFRFLGRERRDAPDVTNALLEWKDAIRAAAPYFIYLHYLDPHAPYAERSPWFDPSTEGPARLVSAYDSEVRYADREIERAFDAFGGFEDAVVIVTADHGEELGDHGGWGHAQHLLAEVLDVPMIVRLPRGQHGGRRVPGDVSHVDLVPTFREAAGLPADPTLPGLSLLPFARAAENVPERALFAHLQRFEEEAGSDRLQRAVLLGEWKLIDAQPDGPMLFHRPDDPGDHHNLAREKPETVAALRARYDSVEAAARRPTAARREVHLDERSMEELKALGYVH